jgi:hypothetical protein
MNWKNCKWEPIKEGRWRYRLTSAWSFPIAEMCFDAECYDGSQFLATFESIGYGVILPGYAIDGATAPWPIRKMLETPRILPAIFKHDLLCQFQCVAAFRNHVVSRREADYMLYDDLREARHPLALPVLLAVRAAARFGPKQHPSLSVTLIDTQEED